MGPICFLNLEGVLHPIGVDYILRGGQRRPDAPFAWAEALRPIAERWDLSFVLRTSVTIHKRGEHLPVLAPAWLWGRVSGICDDKYRYISLDDVRKVNTSWGVIQRYVRKHDITNWVALDDEDDGWPIDPEVRSRLVVCRPEVGVRDAAVLEHLEKALKVVCDAV